MPESKEDVRKSAKVAILDLLIAMETLDAPIYFRGALQTMKAWLERLGRKNK